MRIRIFTRRVVFWSTVLAMLALAAGLWFAYSYVTDSETLASLIRAQAPRYLPDTRLVIGRVRVRPLVGDMNLNQLALWQKLDGADFLALRVPWLDVRHDTTALLNGELCPREIVVAQPVLRLRRRKDGTCNLEGLLARPWPGPELQNPPLILIENGTVQLCDGEAPPAPVLRDLSVRIEPMPDGRFRFEGSAKGDLFEHLSLKGIYDHKTGRVNITEGELTRLMVSKTLRERLPAEFLPPLERLGLNSGEIDLALKSVTYDPAAAPHLHYEATAQLRGGTLDCPRLPFPLNDLAAAVSVADGVLTIERAEAYNGTTTVRARRGGTLELVDPEEARMNVTIDVLNLEFDERLRAWTPPEFAKLWREFRPQGRVSLAVSALRAIRGGPIGKGMGVDFRDVAMLYHLFPYPLEHVHGSLKWEGDRISVDLRTLIGLKPARATGTIENFTRNERDAIVQLDFQAEALPVDKPLLDAMMPDVRTVVQQFNPVGSVRGVARLKRTPPGPTDPPEGKVTIDAYLDLNEGCGITWVGLPYPITDLTGRLELHPHSWVFKNMRGRNALAVITGEGQVEQVARRKLKTELHLRGENLPFSDELRVALPQAWQRTWATLRPSGASTVDAQIRVEPDGTAHHHLVIVPERETRVELLLPRMPAPGVAAGEMFDMPPMERIEGTFVFDDGTVTMNDVRFQFLRSPARFAHGTVTVQDTGQFDLNVKDLEVDDLRIDLGLRKIMPPVMAQFARRVDDGKPFRFRTNMRIGWSGRPGQPAWCAWDGALVVFNGNTIQTGLPLEHLQGQLDHLRGSFLNGKDLEMHGELMLESISLLGQQVTRLSSPVDVSHNRARLDNVRGTLLGGELSGRIEVDLEKTPKYIAALSVSAADLQLYTKSLPGRQHLRGLVSGQVAVQGLGNDLHTLQGRGEVHVTQGDLGQLPAFLRLVKVLNLSPLTKTAFDSADAIFQIENGETQFNPIKFTGNAFSLRGSGTFSAQGELNLGLRVLYGRDEGMHIPVLSDALREASGQIFQIQVLGTPAYPTYHPVALQQATDVFRSLGSRRASRSVAR